MERKSLMDDSMSGVGVKGGSGGGKKSSGGSPDRLKLIVAVVGIVAGVGLIGYTQGMFDFLKPKPEDVTKKFTPAEQEAYQKSLKEKERIDRETPPSGS